MSQEQSKNDLQMLANKAARLRIGSVKATTAAGSGHPTSCASAADIVAALFFSVMRYDPGQPASQANDRFVLSKGHAAPLLYAAWSEAGYLPEEALLTLRKIDSDLEGHPTPRLPFVAAATGSLGQGLPIAVGMAIDAKIINPSDKRVFTLMGDGEAVEGSVWEAAQMASHLRLNNLCAVIDVNRLGQSRPTMLQHDMDTYKARWDAFGWNAIVIDGHDMQSILSAFEVAESTLDRPTILLAKTSKGRDLEGLEDREGWHGKALDPARAETVIAKLQRKLSEATPWSPKLPVAMPSPDSTATVWPSPPYSIGGAKVAPRRAFGDALAAFAVVEPDLVVLDGDVGNSTYTDEFEPVAKDRFIEGYIAEQNIVGVAMGLATTGKIPFASVFACFLSRAYDFARMAAVGRLNIKLAGTHAGISIGEDGASQMGLEDLAMFCAQPNYTVLYPCDATSAWQATRLLAQTKGPAYLRLGRPDADVLYAADEEFEVGKLKTLRSGDQDQVLIVAAGVTVFEALEAYDMLKTVGIRARIVDLFSIQPIDREGLIAAARACGGLVITVEDHYQHGGIGDATASAFSQETVHLIKLAVYEIPRSGKPAELLDKFGISAKHIVKVAKNAVAV